MLTAVGGASPEGWQLDSTQSRRNVAHPFYFEDLNKGDSWTSDCRQVTRECVMAFADLSGDFDRLHVDEEFAQQSHFRQPIAHGLLGLSLLAGLSSTSPHVETIAFTQVGEWNFKSPIYFNDTVHVVNEIVHLQPHGARAGKVTWYRQLINQDGQVVQEGTFETIVAARQATPNRRRVRKPNVEKSQPLGNL